MSSAVRAPEQDAGLPDDRFFNGELSGLDFELELADDTLTWELTQDGARRQPLARRGHVNTQELMQRATLGLVEKGVAAV